MIFRTRTSWESWPINDGDAGLLRPGAAVIGLYSDNNLTGVLRRWVGNGSQWLTNWPVGQFDREPPAPSAFFGAESSSLSAEVWFEVQGFDAEDRIISKAELRPHQPPTWLQEPPAGSQGSVVEALADVLVSAFTPCAPVEFQRDEVMALPGPHVPELHEDLALRSWHVFQYGRSLRALELPPLRDLEDDSIRARRAWLIDSTEPLADPGLALWRRGEVRFWRSGKHPLLDQPLAPRDYSPLESSLAERLLGEAVDHAPRVRGRDVV